MRERVLQLDNIAVEFDWQIFAVSDACVSDEFEDRTFSHCQKTPARGLMLAADSGLKMPGEKKPHTTVKRNQSTTSSRGTQ